jgi:hypothetical protein
MTVDKDRHGGVTQEGLMHVRYVPLSPPVGP